MPTEMDQVQDLVARLNQTKKLRIWSLIITFFGDAIVPRGGAVSARTVQVLLDRMGIEAGAVRTAFSRLTNDGWVVREKIGRSSFYHLSATGLQPFEEATDRIYAPLDTRNGDVWSVVYRPDTYPAPQLIRGSRAPEPGADDFVIQGAICHIPDWVKQRHCLADHADSYHQLQDAFQPLVGAGLSPVDAMVVRCLLIHEWRRILFQYDPVSPEFWTEDWPQAACHQFVSSLYHRLLDSSEGWMDAVATGPDGGLNPPKNPLSTRFT